MTDAIGSKLAGLAVDGVEDADDNQRTRRRDSLFLVAQLREVDSEHATEVRVRNLSEGGLMAEGSHPLDIGTPVTVEMRGVGRVKGRIAWYTEGRAGIAFDTPIDPRKARKPVAVRANPSRFP